jgi:acyl-CoA thioester hydrolase
METFRGVVYPAQCDAQGHVTTKEYLGFFDQAEWHCMLALGSDPRDFEAKGIGWADVKHTLEYKKELKAGDLIRVVSSVTGVGTKSISTRHLLYNASSGELCAELHSVTVQYDLKARRAIPIAEKVRDIAATKIAAASA